MTTTLTVQYAERLAQRDGQELKDMRADAHRGAIRTGDSLIVDGSMYSPSWRALSGGNEAWTIASLEDDADTVVDFQMAYEEALDELTGELGMYWEDGCLWLSLDT